jgi:surfactin synthase thioesterase subunit
MLETPVGDMRKVVDAVMAELSGLMDKPVALFGHSVGAIVAFEVAKECLSRGCASCTGHPRFASCARRRVVR